MDKQELIDKAVEARCGNICRKENPNAEVVLFDGDSFYFVTRIYANCPAVSEACEVICTTDEFEKRARELGWVNGYKFGVEYPTNGKKPDLPDDVFVKIKDNDNYTWKNPDEVRNWIDWSLIKSFRIVDDRYKPKAETVSEFFEKNEPTVCGKPKSENAADKAQVNIFELLTILNDLDHNETTEFVESQEAEALLKKLREFRPIKTDREKFVEEANRLYYTSVDVDHFIQKMFDAGFKAP